MDRKTFSPERLERIRRLRKARRLFKKVPLFAYQILHAEHSSYTYEQFIDDLLLRRKPKQKRKKDNRVRFGRESRIRKLIADFHSSGNVELLIAATKLNQRLRKPYKVVAELKSHRYEFSFPATVSVERIENFTAELAKCKCDQQIKSCYEDFKSTINIF